MGSASIYSESIGYEGEDVHFFASLCKRVVSLVGIGDKFKLIAYELLPSYTEQTTTIDKNLTSASQCQSSPYT